MKAAVPAPLIDADPNTSAGRDRPDMHVTVKDVPAIVTLAAAGEGWHGLSKRVQGSVGKPLQIAR